jgi:LPS-assembly lipoprotein
MWWLERRTATARWARPALALALAGLLAGCFEPLYGQRSPAGEGLHHRLSAVEIVPIPAPSGTPEARVATELRNVLIYDLTGGAGASGRTHRLHITMGMTRQHVIVDITTARPDVEDFRINASFSLTEMATGKVVLTGQTFAHASYDIPGQQQRFARERGLRDAQDRAIKVISGNIRSRLASYFVAGT